MRAYLGPVTAGSTNYPIRVTGVSTRKYGLELVTPMSSNGLETRLSINPFDELGGSFFVVVNGEEQHEMIGVRK